MIEGEDSNSGQTSSSKPAESKEFRVSLKVEVNDIAFNLIDADAEFEIDDDGNPIVPAATLTRILCNGIVNVAITAVDGSGGDPIAEVPGFLRLVAEDLAGVGLEALGGAG